MQHRLLCVVLQREGEAGAVLPQAAFLQTVATQEGLRRAEVEVKQAPRVRAGFVAEDGLRDHLQHGLRQA
ncbi:hypothetical protein FQZ97_811230 [compost metagenome]